VVWSIVLIRYCFGVGSRIGVFLCLWAGQNKGLDLVNVETSSGLDVGGSIRDGKPSGLMRKLFTLYTALASQWFFMYQNVLSVAPIV
jgi:hypothetical protein